MAEDKKHFIYSNMKRFLAQARANNISHRKVKEEPLEVEGCTDYMQLAEIYDPWRSFLKKGEHICIDATNYDFVIFGDSLTIEGIALNGTKFPTTPNAWGATAGKFKVISTKDTSITMLAAGLALRTHGRFYGTTFRELLIMKQHYKGTIKDRLIINAKTLEAFEYKEYAIVLHPNSIMTLKMLNPGWPILQHVELEEDVDPNIPGTHLHGSLYTFEQIEFEETGTVENDVDVTIAAEVEVNITSPLEYFPDQVIELQEGMIFSKSTPEYKGDDHSKNGKGNNGIHPGVIAAIAIGGGVIVAAGCAIAYFVFKNKRRKFESSDANGMGTSLI